ncbi:MAG: ABC transporter ATP-binding protein [Rhodospirillales bacterium RIFCSPLOWO2_12_FULL_58_28]|nr:MAG: ABC transporter ATP-binding protein [Rhodospirillales bacterium RIFCSPLOWO2_02_FULL_58_16]OHC77036.1 MAG: ABC transporter ATP-binding protein [Rhodospirillales bacterium RIFCSPLOWO2_12_FULL_58_28]
MIALKSLTKRFGTLLAVDDVSMSVARGEVLGFLGPNGAGKSTTMKMITGFLPPTSGTAVVAGFDVIENPLEVKRRIGYLPEGAPTYGDMTPAAFLSFISEIRGFSGAESRRRIAEAVDKVELQDVLNQQIDTLSKGFKRRVGLAQAILHDPEVLIMDEPTDGLDPNQKHHVRALIRNMAADKAIIISTHILEEVEAVCTRAVIIAKGRLLADGTPEELLAKAPNHNAVVIRVAADKAKKVCAEIGKLPAAGRVETLDDIDGAAGLRIFARDGGNIAVEIGAMVRDKGLELQEMSIERGSLDEVFREITAGARDGGDRDA